MNIIADDLTGDGIAKLRGYQQLNMETGSLKFFKPAQQLYLKHGFEFCRLFGRYKEDPNSLFMELMLKWRLGY